MDLNDIVSFRAIDFLTVFKSWVHQCICPRFYYYTAGSGGAGPTILATSFLLLGEEVVAYNKGLANGI